MPEKLILRVDPETHYQHLEQARVHTNALQQYSKQLQTAIDESDHRYQVSPLGQYHARRKAKNLQF